MQGLWRFQTLGHTTTSPVEAFNSQIKANLYQWRKSLKGRRMDLLFYVLRRIGVKESLKLNNGRVGQRTNRRASAIVKDRCASAADYKHDAIKEPGRGRPHVWKVRSNVVYIMHSSIVRSCQELELGRELEICVKAPYLERSLEWPRLYMRKYGLAPAASPFIWLQLLSCQPFYCNASMDQNP